jgi:hypothetical protein
MIQFRGFGAVWCGLAAVLLGACYSTNGSDSDPLDPGNETPGQGGSNGGIGDLCIGGRSCDCEPGWKGMTSCVDGEEMCSCVECPGLDVQDVSVVTSCGGEPFGIWRLSQFGLGATRIELSSGGEPVGSCDTVLGLDGDLPHVLMHLQTGGGARYFADAATMTQSWSDDCVTDKVAQLYCGSSSWSGVSNCELDCDICSCDASLPQNDEPYGEWTHTSSILELSLWGTPGEFDYCVEGEQLQLSSEGAYLVFDRVYEAASPTACAGLTPDACMLEENCFLGACGGVDGCATAADTEEDCLLFEGCTWDPERCTDEGQSPCGLGDFGTVPGCELTDEPPLVCTGTPTACDTYDGTSCDTIPGCVWSDESCAGTPHRCSSYSPENCETIPGCQLTPAP